MKQLIVVRHGQYGRDKRLDDCGRAQIDALANKLNQLTSGGTVLILTSSAVRARESAEILASYFSVGFEEHDILWSENSHPAEDLPGTLELVRSRKNDVDVIILVTHYEYVEKFPGYFAKEELGANLHSQLIGKGEAWVVDCGRKTLTRVWP